MRVTFAEIARVILESCAVQHIMTNKAFKLLKISEYYQAILERACENQRKNLRTGVGQSDLLDCNDRMDELFGVSLGIGQEFDTGCEIQ
jgi:hypothetical protein